MTPPHGRGAPDGPQLDAAELDARITGLAAAVRAGSGHVPDMAVEDAAAVLARAGQRRALAGDLTVVALAGPTGAGKSSLFNAIVGTDVARVAPTRPTTAEPLAALWTPHGAAAGLLEWLGVAHWHQVDGAPTGLVLIDLPDLDSTAAAHRREVDRLLARVDVLVWVLDPQKYADAVVHDDYLRAFAGHAPVTSVVLNRADALSPAQARDCVAHLGTLLVRDGLSPVTMHVTSATTGEGIPELSQALHARALARRAWLARLAADVAASAALLRSQAQDTGQPLSPVSPRARAGLTSALAQAAGAQVVADAVTTSMIRRGRAATGWPATRWVGRLRSDPLAGLGLARAIEQEGPPRTELPSASPASVARVANAARDFAAEASQGAPPGWVRSARSVALDSVEGIEAHLDVAVAQARIAPGQPHWWRAVGVAQWALAALAAVGALWLLGLVGLRLLAVDPPDPPTVAGLPVPTVMLVVGALLGVLLSVLARAGVARSARRAAARARGQVEAQVAGVAREQVAEPVEAELATLLEFRVGILAALGE